MKRRSFLRQLAGASVCLPWLPRLAAAAATGDTLCPAPVRPDPALARDWLARWEKHILAASRNRYCDRELGEELGWLVSPFLNGFYHGHLATGEARWADLLADWAAAWIGRGVKEPDGFTGWPKRGSGGAVSEGFLSDSLLGEAMALRPLVLMAGQVQKTAALREKFGPQAAAWLGLAGEVFEKWEARGCWREVREGGLWVAPEFGLDGQSGEWTGGYTRRATAGFSHPANKQNHIARWLLAMADATGKPVYLARAKQWFRLMKSRLRTRAGGRYFVWNYWDPAGPWDYKPDGSPRHWVGVHPNGGYYAIDVEGMVAACERGLVFDREDLGRLIATNRDFMWNQQIEGAKFRRLDGGEPDARWKDSPGVLWTALVPHDATLKRVFLANHQPASWGGLATTPWFLAQEQPGASARH